MPDAKTFKIPSENLPFLTEQIAKLNKKAEKLSKKGYIASPIDMTVGTAIISEKTVRNEITGESHKVEVIHFPVTLVAEPVKAGNFTFIATLQHEEGGTIVRSVAGAVEEGELRKYRDAAPACDHCGFNRRRNDTFVVRENTSGEHKQVGRNCLADFFGFDANGAAAAAELYSSAWFSAGACEDDGLHEGFGPRARPYRTISTFLPHVALVIRRSGWCSRGMAYNQGNTEMATANLAWMNLIECEELARQGKTVPPTMIPSEMDVKNAQDGIEACAAHFDTVNVEALSDYEHNLRVAMSGGVVDFRLAGIVASALNYIKREQEKKAARVDFTNSVHVGELKKRAVFTLKCLYVGGAGRPFKWVDDKGNSVKSWNVDFACEQGATYTVKATPVRHDEYKGIKETMVNRVSLHVEKVKAPRKPRS